MAEKPALAVRAATAAGLAARFVVSNRTNVSAALGIVSMTAGAWAICGAGIALAVFGGFTWITTIIGVELATRPRGGA